MVPFPPVALSGLAVGLKNIDEIGNQQRFVIAMYLTKIIELPVFFDGIDIFKVDPA